MRILKVIIGDNEQEILFNISPVSSIIEKDTEKIPSVFFFYRKSNNKEFTTYLIYVAENSLILKNLNDNYFENKFEIIKNNLNKNKKISLFFLDEENNIVKKIDSIKSIMYEFNLLPKQWHETMYLSEKKLSMELYKRGVL